MRKQVERCGVSSDSITATIVDAPKADGGGTCDAFRAEGLWYVLHTRSRQEKALGVDLDAMGVAYLLPLVSVVRYCGRRKTTVQAPLFPGYIFLRGSIEQAYEADRTRRVANIIKVTDQDFLEDELRGIAHVLSQGGELDPHPYLQKGVWVEVRSGPFKGVQGVVEDRKANRLILQIQVLGQASSLEIDAALLDPIA